MPGLYVESIKQRASLPFNPGPSHRPHTPCFNAQFTPRFLYRLVAPRSAGTTTPSLVVPPAVSGGEQDIFGLPPAKAARLLLNHLLWQTGHADGCNLMSWTSSLLFALQYALYRHRRNGDNLSQIHLIVLDTSGFPAGTFIQDMEIMRALQGVDAKLQKFVEFRESEYYFGEYLTQGRLDIEGQCVCAPVQKMIDLGLFELQPALGEQDHWQCWPKRVLDFRVLFEKTSPVATTDGQVETAVDIARECFGGGWTVAGAIMLLALQRRMKDEGDLVRGLKARFTVTDVRRAGLDKMRVDSRRLPEVAQFKELVELVQQSYEIYDIESLVDAIQGLSV
ncbi:hypothetical protein BJX61DRAFT_535843 [Aspergillus egyptiacus]|nr:hypothetical protein BJX61DRAFT_535843 [Aspergillus egyptiacus]